MSTELANGNVLLLAKRSESISLQIDAVPGLYTVQVVRSNGALAVKKVVVR